MSVTLFTVNGTGSFGPDDPGQYPVQVAQALLPQPMQAFNDRLDGIDRVGNWPWQWYAIDYPASIYPMGASAAVGVTNLVASIGFTPGKFALAGYSQGAIVTSHVWRDYILNPNGVLHDRLNDFVGAVNWGNPLRCPGIANGNAYAGWPMPTGDFTFGGIGNLVTAGGTPGGIAGADDLTVGQTPNNWLDFANSNDLYTDCPIGSPAGSDETMIYKIVMANNFGGSVEAIMQMLESYVAQLVNPLSELVGVVEAIVNGLKFAAAGPTAGHYTYDIGPAIAYLTGVGNAYAGS